MGGRGIGGRGWLRDGFGRKTGWLNGNTGLETIPWNIANDAAVRRKGKAYVHLLFDPNEPGRISDHCRLG